MNQVVIVCGGRSYTDREHVFLILDTAHAANPISYLVSGAARGADALAEEWAKARGVPVERYPALWEEHGRRAGPIRNQLMLDDAGADMVIAFPGGRGTADMVRRAEMVGVPVVRAVKAVGRQIEREKSRDA